MYHFHWETDREKERERLRDTERLHYFIARTKPPKKQLKEGRFIWAPSSKVRCAMVGKTQQQEHGAELVMLHPQSGSRKQ